MCCMNCGLHITPIWGVIGQDRMEWTDRVGSYNCDDGRPHIPRRE